MRKKAVILMLMVAGLQFASGYSCASGAQVPEEYSVLSENQVRSQDKIVIKYRTHNGKEQYRRWNDTKQCWVDPKWIDLP